MLPLIPAPPDTTNAPVVVLVETVPLFAVSFPDTTSVPVITSVTTVVVVPLTVRFPPTVTSLVVVNVENVPTLLPVKVLTLKPWLSSKLKLLPPDVLNENPVAVALIL
jgi:hypothetical protein